MRLHLEACTNRNNFKTKLANRILEALEVRSDTVFNTQQMECCLFLDPRYRDCILRNNEAVERAKAAAIKVWARVNGLGGMDCMHETSNESSDLNFSFDEFAALKEYVNSNENMGSTREQRHMTIEDTLDAFQPERLPPEKSVLQFWEDIKGSNPLLYNVASAIYSIPPTQVQIERDFSKLKHVVGDRRYRLSQELLEAILMIHLNKEVFYEVKEEQLNKLKNF